ncbi:hypothetical protein ACFL4W_01020 [Planctomycetota bacterium]
MKEQLKKWRGLPLGLGLLCSLTQWSFLAGAWMHVGLSTVCIGLELLLWGMTADKSEWQGLMRMSWQQWAVLLWPLAVLTAMLGWGQGSLKTFIKEWAQFGTVFVIVPILCGRLLSGPGSRDGLYGRILWTVFLVSSLAGWFQYTGLSMNEHLFADAARVGGFLGNRNLYGALLALLLPLLADDLCRRRPSTWKVPCGLYMGLSLITILNAGLLIAAAAGTVFVLASRRRLGRILIWSLVLYVLAHLSALIVEVKRNEVLDRNMLTYSSISTTFLGFAHEDLLLDSIGIFSQDFRQGQSGTIRQYVLEYHASLSVIRTDPVCGRGFGNYQDSLETTLLDETFMEQAIEPDRASLWLVLAVEAGLPLLLLIGVLIIRAWRSDLPLPAGRRGALLGLVLIGCFTSPAVRGTEILVALVLSNRKSTQ